MYHGKQVSSVGKLPGFLLNTAAILCTGVFIAPPRTAATTYEMAVVPLTDKIGLFPFSIVWCLCNYSLCNCRWFFIVCSVIAVINCKVKAVTKGSARRHMSEETVTLVEKGYKLTGEFYENMICDLRARKEQ